MKTMPRSNDQIPWLTLAMFAVIFLVTGCALAFSPTDAPASKIPIDTGVTPPQSLTGLPILGVTSIPACIPKIVNLSAFVSKEYKERTHGYGWSEDGLYYYFQAGEQDWWKYSPESEEIFRLYDQSIFATPTFPPYELSYLPGLDASETRYRSHPSPSGMKLIYWDYPDHSNVKVPTLEPNDPAAKYELATDVFLLQRGQVDPLYMGTVDSAVQMVYWLPGEERALLRMVGGVRGSTLWLLDIPEQSLTPFLSLADTREKILSIEISPDGNWVMYETSSVAIKNTRDFSTRQLAIPRGWGVWWMPDGKRIITLLPVDDEDTSNISVFLYNLDSEELTRLVAEVLNSPTGVSFQFFPDYTMMAATDYESGDLYMLKLCVGNDG